MERTTYNNLMNLMKSMWNYKYHNSPANNVEPYPNELMPSEIYKRLNPKFHYANESEILQHADHIHLNKTLRGKTPFKVIFLYNNPTPYSTIVYANSIDRAKHIAINEFSNYLKSKNNMMYKVNSIIMGIKNKLIELKIKEI